MKKIMLIAACLGFMATAAFAQTQNSAASKTLSPAPNAKATTKYYCPKCMAASDKAGTCAHCKVALVKEGDYYCPGCYMASAKPGKCPNCKKDLVKMTGKKA
jgi:hypothetical protein